MPIYEYVCQDCGERFEIMRSMKDADAPTPCSKCTSGHTSRMLSLFFAQSDGRAVAGGNSACGTCSSTACGSCSVRH